jgi:hypothetical protein
MAFVVGNVIINYSDNLPYYLAYNWYAWALVGADLSWRLRRVAKRRLQTVGSAIGDAPAPYRNGAQALSAVPLRARPAAGGGWSAAE